MKLAAAQPFVLLAILIAPGVARAQDPPKVGLAMGYPASVGVVWHLVDRVALRPEFTWSKVSNDSPAITDPVLGEVGAATTSGTWQAATGLSALVYLSRHDSLRTYVAPRLAYSRTSGSTGVPGTPTSSSTITEAWSTTGSFGAQYAFGRHLALFGEVGMNYQASATQLTLVETRTIATGVGPGGVITTTSSFSLGSESHNRSISTRSGVGMIFYF